MRAAIVIVMGVMVACVLLGAALSKRVPGLAAFLKRTAFIGLLTVVGLMFGYAFVGR